MSRKHAREVTFKLLFESSFQKEELINTLYTRYKEDEEISKEEEEYILDVIEGVQSNLSSIDEKIESHLKDWNFKRLSQVDISILRLSIFELFYRDDIPEKVSINEAVELAKVFGDDNSPKFINGILAEIIKDKSK